MGECLACGVTRGIAGFGVLSFTMTDSYFPRGKGKSNHAASTRRSYSFQMGNVRLFPHSLTYSLRRVRESSSLICGVVFTVHG